MSFGLDNQEAVHSINQYLLSMYFVPGTILGVENITLMEAEFLVISWQGKSGNKSTNK